MLTRSFVYAVFAVLGLVLPAVIAPAAAQVDEFLAPTHACMGKAIEGTITPPDTTPTPMGDAKSAALDVLVGPDGRVLSVRITRGSNVESLDKAALEHVRQHWRYEPLVEGCRSAYVRANIYFPVLACVSEPLRDTQTVPETEPLEPGQGRSAEMLVTVDADGKAEKVVISRSSGMDALDKAGMAHVLAHWRWQPFTCFVRRSLETRVSIDFPVLVPPAGGWPGDPAPLPRKASGKAP